MVDMSDGELDANIRVRRRNAAAVGDFVRENLAPALKKRGFASADLILRWGDIVGPAYARTTQPESLNWPRRPRGVIGDDNTPEPAILTVRCLGAMALRLTHDSPQLIERINSYFGYRVIGRIKIMQAPLQATRRVVRPIPAPLSPADAARIEKITEGIESDKLRRALANLGESVRKARRDGRNRPTSPQTR